MSHDLSLTAAGRVLNVLQKLKSVPQSGRVDTVWANVLGVQEDIGQILGSYSLFLQ